ncbi:hypothetical protein GCK72_005695 [Caenorhabditis remanei]|nr:hypothetical protein GCK72_005695 [Caenorhabditis remanei]KAF1765742.1 hypothetical protein GCK72_005695 [Caenorhabditis remanei]
MGDEPREPEAKEGKSDEVFEVEKILDHRVTNNQLQLKVRWLGYGPDDDTFEPEDDIKECASEVVEEYYRKMKVNDKTELIERLQKEIKRTKKQTAKKRERSPSPDVDDDGSESDASYSSAKKNKKASRNATPSSTSKAAKVPTKAALKSYDSHGHVPPNKAKQAATRIRTSMFGDSSDEEDASPVRSAVDELQSKVKPKETKDVFQSPIQRPAETPKPKTEYGSNVTSKQSSSPQPCSSSAVSSSYKPSSGNLETNGRHRSLELPHKKKDEPLWSVTGIVRHKNESNVVDKLILMTNRDTGDRKVLNPDEAFNLDSWALTKYLLDRCEF